MYQVDMLAMIAKQRETQAYGGPAREAGLSEVLMHSVDQLQGLLSTLRDSRSKLFPPTPEPVSDHSNPPAAGPPTIASQAAAIRDMLGEANFLASNIAARL